MKRLFLAFCLLLAGAAAAIGEPSPSVIPLTLTHSDYDGGRIYLPVRLGNALGTMRLDTGASSSRVTVAPWNRELPRIGESHSTAANGEALVCDDVEASNVALRASEGNAIARARYRLTRCPRGDGDDLLGIDFFRGTHFALDLDRRRMVFFGKAADGRPAPFRLLGDQRLIGLPVQAGDAATVGLFDTGAEISAVDQRFVDAHRKLFTPVKSRLKASAASGGAFTSKLYRVRQIAFGDGRAVRGLYALAYDFGPLRAALGPDVSFILGYNFLNRFNWEIDLSNPAAPAWAASPRR